MAKYYSTKTYGNDRGLSCAFRQWRSTHSHCSLLHGYSIGIRLVFEAETLDSRNWVMDFGGLKKFKQWDEHMFDHTTLVAEDDPGLGGFKTMDQLGIIQLRILPATGAERFAEFIFNKLNTFIQEETSGRVKVVRVEFMEHNKNTAIYEG